MKTRKQSTPLKQRMLYLLKQNGFEISLDNVNEAVNEMVNDKSLSPELTDDEIMWGYLCYNENPVETDKETGELYMNLSFFKFLLYVSYPDRKQDIDMYLGDLIDADPDAYKNMRNEILEIKEDFLNYIQ